MMILKTTFEFLQIVILVGWWGCSNNGDGNRSLAGWGGAVANASGAGDVAVSAGGAGGNSGADGRVTASGGGGASGARIGAKAGSGGKKPDGGAGTNASIQDSNAGASGRVGGQRSTGPGDWGPGEYPPGDIAAENYLEISGVKGQNDNVRQYKVHVPPTYDSKKPTPLVFCIHGLMQTGVLFCVTGTQLNLKSDKEGFIMVIPLGYQNSWNAGTCCGGASSEQLDDVALFRAILEEVGKHLNIDLNRVYATGLSNGGYMSYRLACEASDIFAAVAPGAGGVGTNDNGTGTNLSSDFTACEPSQKLSVLDIHGDADMLVPYSIQKPSLENLATKNGCSLTTGPASAPRSGGDTTCVTYAGCPGGIEVTGCTVRGGGHCWFGSPDCGTGGGDLGTAIVGANSNTMVNNDAVWDFFKRHSR